MRDLKHVQRATWTPQKNKLWYRPLTLSPIEQIGVRRTGISRKTARASPVTAAVHTRKKVRRWRIVRALRCAQPLSFPTLDSVLRPGLGYEVKPAPRRGHGSERNWVLRQGMQNRQHHRRPPGTTETSRMTNYRATCQKLHEENLSGGKIYFEVVEDDRLSLFAVDTLIIYRLL